MQYVNDAGGCQKAGLCPSLMLVLRTVRKSQQTGHFQLETSKPLSPGACNPGLYESKCLILCGKLNTAWQPGINLDALTGRGVEWPV